MTTSNSVTLKTINSQSSKCEAQATKLETKIKTINNRPIKQVRSTSALSDQQYPKRTPSFQYHHLQSPPLHPIQHHHHQSPTPSFGAKRLSPLPRGFRGCGRNRRPDADLYKPLPIQNYWQPSTPRLYITKKPPRWIQKAYKGRRLPTFPPGLGQYHRHKCV